MSAPSCVEQALLASNQLLKALTEREAPRGLEFVNLGTLFGDGSTFRVFLPTASPPPSSPERREPAQGLSSYSPPG